MYLLTIAEFNHGHYDKSIKLFDSYDEECRKAVDDNVELLVELTVKSCHMTVEEEANYRRYINEQDCFPEGVIEYVESREDPDYKPEWYVCLEEVNRLR